MHMSKSSRCINLDLLIRERPHAHFASVITCSTVVATSIIAGMPTCSKQASAKPWSECAPFAAAFQLLRFRHPHEHRRRRLDQSQRSVRAVDFQCGQ